MQVYSETIALQQATFIWKSIPPVWRRWKQYLFHNFTLWSPVSSGSRCSRRRSHVNKRCKRNESSLFWAIFIVGLSLSLSLFHSIQPSFIVSPGTMKWSTKLYLPLLLDCGLFPQVPIEVVPINDWAVCPDGPSVVSSIIEELWSEFSALGMSF